MEEYPNKGEWIFDRVVRPTYCDLYGSSCINMHTQTDWGVLPLTLITTVAKFESGPIKDRSSLQQQQCDLRCFYFSSLHHFLFVFCPQGSSRLSPKASWLNAYLAGELWLVCACACQREWVCLGANECVSSCGPVHHVALIGCEGRTSKTAPQKD